MARICDSAVGAREAECMKTAKASRSVENLSVASVEPAISGSRALSPDNSTRRPGKQPGQHSPSQLRQETHSSWQTSLSPFAGLAAGIELLRSSLGDCPGNSLLACTPPFGRAIV